MEAQQEQAAGRPPANLERLRAQLQGEISEDDGQDRQDTDRQDRQDTNRQDRQDRRETPFQYTRAGADDVGSGYSADREEELRRQAEEIWFREQERKQREKRMIEEAAAAQASGAGAMAERVNEDDDGYLESGHDASGSVGSARRYAGPEAVESGPEYGSDAYAGESFEDDQVRFGE